MRRVCVGSCGTTCLTEIFPVQARLATRIGFYGLFAGLEAVAIGSVLLFIPRIHIHEPNDFDAFKGVFGRCLTLGVGTKGVFHAR